VLGLASVIHGNPGNRLFTNNKERTVIYECLTDEELERWVYSKPDDKDAAAEVVRRLGNRIDVRDFELEEANAEIDCLNKHIARLEFASA
jgi:hypothetical protein